MTLYLVEVPPGGNDELTLRAHRLFGQAALILAGQEAGQRLERAGMPGGVPGLSPAGVGPARVVTAVQDAADRPVVWAVPGVGRWPEAERAVLSAVLAAGVEVLPVPGGASWIGCLAASGLPSDRFTFLGQLPAPAAARRAQLERFHTEQHTLIWLLPVGARADALRDAAELLGERSAALCSESGIWRGKLQDAPPGALDAVLIVEGASEEQAWTEGRVRERVRQLLGEGASTRDASREVAEASGWPRRQVYAIALEVGAG